MKHIFVFLMLMLCSTLAFGQATPTPSYCGNLDQAAKSLNLSPDQISKMQDQCSKVSEITDNIVFTDKVKAIGESIGIAIGSTAKQLNVAANDFVKSPAGIITVSLIVAKMFGGSIIKFLFLGFAWLVFTKLFIWVLKRVFEYTAVYETTPVLFGLWQRRKLVNSTYKSFNQFEDGNYGTLALVGLAYLGVSALLICNMF